MKYIVGKCSDKGVRKGVNQDSVILAQASYDNMPVILAAVCDGVGGLSKGEVASSMMIDYFKNWFMNDFSHLMTLPDYAPAIEESLSKMIKDASIHIYNYGKENNISLGTTLTGVLVVDGSFICFHIGDSRLYLIDSHVHQLTKDHTLVQQLIDKHVLTVEEARTDKRRNVLLQCIGTHQPINIDFIKGTFKNNDVLLLCSDGFYHKLSHFDILENLKSSELTDRTTIENHIQNLIDYVKARGETDNISAIVIKAGDDSG